MDMLSRRSLLKLGGAACVAAQTSALCGQLFHPSEFGAKSDGVADDTAALQKALDAAGRQGGIVQLASGKYLVSGSLKIPSGVALVGVNHAPISGENNRDGSLAYCDPAILKRIRTQGLEADPLLGSAILATGGRDREDGPALFEMGNSSTVQGLVVFYPEQKIDDVHPYAWTFHLYGSDNTVENVTLINSYNGIRVGPEMNARHRIRSVVGCVLRRGIWVDNCLDIGRIENIQWNWHWWVSRLTGGDTEKVGPYMEKNCEGFIFGKTDWEYVSNTFIVNSRIGYRFIRTPHGLMNGQFYGMGADWSQRCIVIEAVQTIGLQITNGLFVANRGDNPTQVVIEPTCGGSVRFQNCAFWGQAAHNVVSHGDGFLSLNNCYLGRMCDKDVPHGGRAIIDADNGKLQVEGCTFATAGPSVRLGKGLRLAIVTGNNGAQGVEVV
ncbi:MAG: glycosyl hydrolase family 28-related protein, partial [Phycisphaerales bacterium]